MSQHAEQDHSGAIPFVLEKYPAAQLLCSQKAAGMLQDLLDIPSERVRVVQDRETLSLGDRTLEFIYTPWVHWPETMCTYLVEERMLFSGDFFRLPSRHNRSVRHRPGARPGIRQALLRGNHDAISLGRSGRI